MSTSHRRHCSLLPFRNSSKTNAHSLGSLALKPEVCRKCCVTSSGILNEGERERRERKREDGEEEEVEEVEKDLTVFFFSFPKSTESSLFLSNSIESYSLILCRRSPHWSRRKRMKMTRKAYEEAW